MRYRIRHETKYHYQQPVLLSQQELHLAPRPLLWQRVHTERIDIQPSPDFSQLRIDSFGNPCQTIEINQPHQHLSLVSELDISVLPRDPVVFAASLPWEVVATQCRYPGSVALSPEQREALIFRHESPLIRIKNEFADWAAPCLTPGRPIFQVAHALMQRIFSELTFDTEATDIGTPLLDVLRKKRGVCQDFAQLMIACLRSYGLPARYVSGYLLTQPPPGEPRLIGADASHAWVSVWCPTLGWMDFDPTNNLSPRQQHITLAWGRDFTDISPLRGVIRGGGHHELTVRVTVAPYEDRLLPDA
jgi:transglutaminase-like putative cysteine protease